MEDEEMIMKHKNCKCNDCINFESASEDAGGNFWLRAGKILPNDELGMVIDWDTGEQYNLLPSDEFEITSDHGYRLTLLFELSETKLKIIREDVAETIFGLLNNVLNNDGHLDKNEKNLLRTLSNTFPTAAKKYGNTWKNLLKISGR